METNASAGRSRWRRIAAVLSLLIGGFMIFLALGLGVVGSSGVSPGAIVVFGTLVVLGGAIAAWGIRELRS